MLILSKNNFDAVIAENELVVVSFSAKWCAPCCFFAQVCEAVARQHPDVVFGNVDIEAESDLADEFGVRSIPAVMVLKHRVVVYANTGALSETLLTELISKAKSLDASTLLKEVENIE